MQYDMTIVDIVEELRGTDTNMSTKKFWYRVANKLHLDEEIEQLGHCCYRRSGSFPHLYTVRTPNQSMSSSEQTLQSLYLYQNFLIISAHSDLSPMTVRHYSISYRKMLEQSLTICCGVCRYLTYLAPALYYYGRLPVTQDEEEVRLAQLSLVKSVKTFRAVNANLKFSQVYLFK